MLDQSFEPYTFDIETLDLAGSAEVLGWCLYNVVDGTYSQEFRSRAGIIPPEVAEEDVGPIGELGLLELLSADLKTTAKLGGVRLVTYNGESYRGGFDLPFLRRRYIENRLQDRWPFKGIRHLDLLPIVQTKLNMSCRQPATLEMLDSAQLAELVGLCGMKPGRTKAANLELVSSGGAQKLLIVTDYCSKIEPPVVTDNKLDRVYELLHGPDLDVAHIDGSKVPGLWKQYLESGDEQIRRDLMRYNLSDCQQTAHVFKELYPLLPEDVEREWRRL